MKNEAETNCLFYDQRNNWCRRKAFAISALNRYEQAREQGVEISPRAIDQWEQAASKWPKEAIPLIGNGIVYRVAICPIDEHIQGGCSGYQKKYPK